MNILEQAAARKAIAEANDLLASKLPPAITESKALADVVTFVKAPDAPKGAFKALELTRFVTADGSWVEAKNGYFEPKTQEEFDMLMHYAGMYNKVEAPTEE